MNKSVLEGSLHFQSKIFLSTHNCYLKKYNSCSEDNTYVCLFTAILASCSRYAWINHCAAEEYSRTAMFLTFLSGDF